MLDMVFRELQDMRQKLDRYFGDGAQDAARQGGAASDWVFLPPVETGWTDERLSLRFVLPAVREKDIDLTVQGNQLVVRGERKAPESFGSDDSTYHRLTYGRFERIVDLPNGLDLEKLEASLHDGVLDVLIPIAEVQKPKKIQISAGKKPKAIAA